MPPLVYKNCPYPRFAAGVFLPAAGHSTDAEPFPSRAFSAGQGSAEMIARRKLALQQLRRRLSKTRHLFVIGRYLAERVATLTFVKGPLFKPWNKMNIFAFPAHREEFSGTTWMYASHCHRVRSPCFQALRATF